MATIKSYTNISQSKTLSKILPLESADMCYQVGVDLDGYLTKTIYTPLMHTPYNDGYIPCWSLAALFSILPKGYSLGRRTNGKYYVCMTHIKHNISEFDNPVDACVDVIEKLHELNLL